MREALLQFELRLEKEKVEREKAEREKAERKRLSIIMFVIGASVAVAAGFYFKK